MFFVPVVRTRAIFPRSRSYDRSFERFIDDAFFTPTAGGGVQLKEDEQSWTVQIDLPGVTREDLAIGVEGSVVRIETREQSPRQYKVAYELPQDIDVDATQARLENGVLTLTLAKQRPVSKVRQIPLA